MSKVKIPSVVELLKAGMHFGHQSAKWHPKMKKFIFTQKNGIHIIDLQKTVEKLQTALDRVTEITAAGGTVLFVGTKPQAKKLIQEHAMRCEMPYIDQRWIGGLLTNFNIVIKLARKLSNLKAEKASGGFTKYTKKEALMFDREITRLETVAAGIESLQKLPDAVFIVDIKNDKTALIEATTIGLETFGICDTNVNPKVDHIIPANDDAVQSLEIIISLMADAVLEGKKNSGVKKTVKAGKTTKK